jgi:hypothetical protein
MVDIDRDSFFYSFNILLPSSKLLQLPKISLYLLSIKQLKCILYKFTDERST